MEDSAMIWTDIIVEKMISDNEICSILQSILQVPINKIKVIEDYDDFPEANTMFAVCQKSKFEAGFSLLLSIYLYGETMDRAPEIERFALYFSSLSNSRCLTPTEDEMPNQMYLFDGERIEIVQIDENKLENEEQYFIAGDKGRAPRHSS